MSLNKKSKQLTSSHTEKEHFNNLASLHRRIQDVGNKQDRKKNPFDPIGNPVYFFTKKEMKNTGSISLAGYAK
jgi:hypothetical protein